MLNSINPERDLSSIKDSGLKRSTPFQKSSSQTTFKSDSFSFSGSDSEGKKFHFNATLEKYSSFDISLLTGKDKKAWSSLSEKSNNEFNLFFKTTISIEISFSTGQRNDYSSDELIDKLDDFWKPEAVADRIAGFVTSFEGKTDAKDQEFFKLMRDAVLEGAKQALDKLKGAPDGVLGVANETLRLLEEKLFAWGEERGVLPEEESSSGRVDFRA